VTQRIEPVGPRRDVAPIDSLRMLTPVEREADKRRRERERERRRRSSRPPRDGAAPGSVDVRA
jgi:hypothetical protein